MRKKISPTSNVNSSFDYNKCLIVTAFLFLLTALFLAILTPPAIGYESSLYEAYPSFFWFFLLAALSNGIIVLMRQAFSKKPSQWWHYGFLIMLLSNTLFLLLPLFRGYAILGRGDVLTHIGYIKEIINTGNFAISGNLFPDIYPALHILVADLSLLTNVSTEFLAELVPIFFTIFYSIGVYLLSKQFTNNIRSTIVITAFGCILLLRHENLMLTSSVQCFYLLPFTIFVFLKTQQSKKTLPYISILILLLATVFLHPGEGTLFLMVIFLTFALSVRLYRRLIGRKLTSILSGSFKLTIFNHIYLILLFLAWFIWFSQTVPFSTAINKIWIELIYGIGQTTATEYFTVLERTSLSTFELMRVFIAIWGNTVIYCLIGLIFLIFTFKKVIFNRYKVNFQLLLFSLWFIAFVLLLFFSIFSNSLSVEFNREMRYVLFAATFLNGFGLFSVFKHKPRHLGIFFISLILIIAAVIGVFNTYPSPIMRDTNSQVTNMELTGMRWFFTNQNPSLLIDTLGVDQVRFANALVEVNSISAYRPSALPPIHFGYADNYTYGGQLDQNRYFIYSVIVQHSLLELSAEDLSRSKFTLNDLYQLNNHDVSVNKVYSNGELWIYFVFSV